MIQMYFNDNKYIFYGNDKAFGFVSVCEDTVDLVMLVNSYRGKGLVKYMYNAVERHRNKALKPSEVILSAAMVNYWRKRGYNVTLGTEIGMLSDLIVTPNQLLAKWNRNTKKKHPKTRFHLHFVFFSCYNFIKENLWCLRIKCI